MKSVIYIKSIFVVIGYIIWKSLVLSCILLILVNYAGHNPRIVNFILSNYTGKKVKIDNINYDFNRTYSSVCLTINGFELVDEQYDKLKDLIKSDKVVINLNINSLFSDTIIINNVNLYGAKLNINLFNNGDTFFDKYSDTKTKSKNILIKSVELDSCFVSYSLYDSDIEEFVTSKVPEYHLTGFVDNAEFAVDIYIEDIKNRKKNESIDKYYFNVIQCCGNLNKFCNFDKEILSNQKIEIQDAEILYEYNSISDNSRICLSTQDTAYLGNISFVNFLLSMQYNPSIYNGKINGNFTFPVNCETLSFASYLLDYDFDGVLLKTVLENEINSVLKNLDFSWEYNYSDEFVKLFFKSDCSITGISEDFFFDLRGLKKIDSDFCLMYFYDSIAGVEKDSIVIKELNVMGLNSVLFSNKDIILTSTNPNSELDLDIGFNADLAYFYQLEDFGIIESLSGRISTESIKIKALFSDFSISRFSELLKKVDIEQAKINSANLKIKDFIHEFQSINAIFNYKNSRLKITDSDFILGKNKFSMNVESENINSFYNDSLIKLFAILSSECVDVNSLSECFKYDNSVDNSEKSENSFIDRLNFNISLVFDSIIYKTRLESEQILPVLVRKMDEIDNFSLFLDSISYVRSSEIDVNATNFVSDLLFFHNSLELLKCNLLIYGAEANIVGKTVFDSTLYSDYNIQLRNIDSYRLESEFGLSISEFLQSAEKVYPQIDSLIASIKLSFEKSYSLVRIAFPETLVYLSKIDFIVDKNKYSSDTIRNSQIDGFDEFVFNTNIKNFDKTYTNTENARYLGKYNPFNCYRDSAKYINLINERNDTITISLRSNLLKEFIFSDEYEGVMCFPINLEEKDTRVKKDTSSFDLFYGKLNLYIDDIFLINSTAKADAENDTLFNISNIVTNPVYSSGNLSADIFEFDIFNGKIGFSNFCFRNSTENSFNLNVEKVIADSLQFSNMLYLADKLRIFSDTLFKSLISNISDFNLYLSGDFAINNADYDSFDFSFDGINEISEYNILGTSDDFNWSYSDSVKPKNTDMEFFKNEKKKKKQDENSPKIDGYTYNFNMFFNDLRASIISDSSDLLMNFESKMNDVPLKINYIEGEKYNFSAENIRLKEFIEFSKEDLFICDFVNNIVIKKLNINSDSLGNVKMKILVNELSFKVSPFINFIITEANILQLKSDHLSLKEFDFELNMVDTIINNQDTVTKIVIEGSNVIVNNHFTMFISGEYYKNSLFMTLFLYPINDFGKNYTINLTYKDDLISVNANGMGLLNMVFKRILGKHEDYIISKLDTSYETFSEINKANKKLIKKEKKQNRKIRRKNNRKK